MRTRLILFLISLVHLPSFSCSTKALSGTDLRTGQWVTVDPKTKPKGTVVVFLSAKCPCSLAHEKSLEALAQDFSQVSFVAVHSNKDEDPHFAEKHFQESHFSFPVIQDDNFKLADEFRALKTPHAFIVGPKGECWFNGGVDDSTDSGRAKKHYLKVALLDLKNGNEPREKQVRTLGCIIKR